MLQSRNDDAALEFSMKRDAKVVPHHEGHEDGAWWLGMPGYVKCDRNRDSGDVSALNSALNQRD
jgi:hypothetical protein